jgi:colanic acid/amylovoran biosynthesis protein
MKKVLVHAFTQFNLGDDLFIKVLCERYTHIQFVISAPQSYKYIFRGLTNLSVFPNDTVWVRGMNYLFRRLGVNHFTSKLLGVRCEAVVRIGGSLFMQGENWRKDLEHAKSMQINNKPFFLLGANFGPFFDEEFLYSYQELFKGYTDLCVRDRYSFELLKDLGHVRLASDIIFQMPKLSNRAVEPAVVISVIKPSYRKSLAGYDEVYYQKMMDLTVEFIKMGYRVMLVSFCTFEGDQEAVEEIIKLIPEIYFPQVEAHYYRDNLEQTLQLISDSSFIIATRFHAMILGWVYQKPVFPVVYSEKMLHVMDDVGFSGLYSDFSGLAALKAETIINYLPENLIDVSLQVRDAEKHFEKLDKYLR